MWAQLLWCHSSITNNFAYSLLLDDLLEVARFSAKRFIGLKFRLCHRETQLHLIHLFLYGPVCSFPISSFILSKIFLPFATLLTLSFHKLWDPPCLGLYKSIQFQSLLLKLKQECIWSLEVVHISAPAQDIISWIPHTSPVLDLVTIGELICLQRGLSLMVKTMLSKDSQS